MRCHPPPPPLSTMMRAGFRGKRGEARLGSRGLVAVSDLEADLVTGKAEPPLGRVVAADLVENRDRAAFKKGAAQPRVEIVVNIRAVGKEGAIHRRNVIRLLVTAVQIQEQLSQQPL